jgi:hypothetical protein
MCGRALEAIWCFWGSCDSPRTAHIVQNSLDSIIKSSRKVEHQINLIATATTEQTAASAEIAESAGHIFNLAQDGAQAAEDASEAGTSLSLLAHELNGLFIQFHIGDGVPAIGKQQNTSRMYHPG